MRLSKYFPPSVLLLLLFLSISSLNAIGQTSPLVDRDTFYIFGIQEQEFKKQFFEYFASNCTELENKLNQGAKLEDNDQETLKTELGKFKATFA